MKMIMIFYFLTSIVFIGCDKDSNINKEYVSTLILNDTIEIAYHETKYNYENQISIYMDSVLNDSRCPSNVICVWAGNAEVRFIFSTSNNKINLRLNTYGGDRFKKDSLINGYRIKLLNLSPYPDTRILIKQEYYRAKIMIKKE